jgi:hypothetical protein
MSRKKVKNTGAQAQNDDKKLATLTAAIEALPAELRAKFFAAPSTRIAASRAESSTGVRVSTQTPEYSAFFIYSKSGQRLTKETDADGNRIKVPTVAGEPFCLANLPNVQKYFETRKPHILADLRDKYNDGNVFTLNTFNNAILRAAVELLETQRGAQ